MNIPHFFRNPRFWHWGGAFLPVLLIVAHTAYWYVAMRAVEQNFHAGVAQYRAQGWVVEHGVPQRAGWPVRAMLSVPDLHLTAGQDLLPGGIDWRVRNARLGITLIQPRTVLTELSGQQILRMQGRDIPFIADRMVLRVFVTPGVPPREGTLRIAMLRAGIGGGALMVENGRMTWTLRPAATESETALSSTISLDDIHLPSGGLHVLGERIDHLRAEAALIGPLPGGRGNLARRVTVWRDEGGTLRLQQVHLNWGQMQVAASATLALDDGLQPMGAANVHVADAQKALDAMAANDVLAPQMIMVVRHALEFFHQTPAADGSGTITEVPLVLQNRALSMGRMVLMETPMLDWRGED